MAAVVLILGLVAAGVYTGSPGFYVAAAIGGGVYALLLLAFASIAAAAKNEIKRQQKRSRF